MNSYDLSRNFWNWAFDNPELISPNHAAIYFFALEHCNRLGWKKKFGFPSQMTMDAIGIKKYQTYIRYFNELVEYGFFKMIQKSKNQYSANIISIINALPKKDKALDKAIIKHGAKQTQTNGQSNSTVDKPLNKGTNKPIKKEENIIPPSLEMIEIYSKSRGSKVNINKFFNHYESNGWFVGKAKMKNWHAAYIKWEPEVKKELTREQRFVR